MSQHKPKEHLAGRFCTASSSRGKLNQVYFRCSSCFPHQVEVGICAECSVVCHSSHKLTVHSGQIRCACSKGKKTKCLLFKRRPKGLRKPRGSIELKEPISPKIVLNKKPYRFELDRQGKRKRLGSGACSIVYLGYYENPKPKEEEEEDYIESQKVAIKYIDFEELNQMQTDAEKELELMMSLPRSDYLVQKICSDQDEKKMVLCLEFCDMGTLDKYISQKKKLTEAEMRGVLHDMVHGLKVLHQRRVIHRDLKPENLFLKSDEYSEKGFTCKIGDFGLSRYRTAEECLNENFLVTSVGTPLYMPPELLQNQPCTDSLDLWSVGCIVYEMICGKSLFIKPVSMISKQLLYQPPRWPEDIKVSVYCKELVRKLVIVNKKHRMDYVAFFKDPYIQCLDMDMEEFMDYMKDYEAQSGEEEEDTFVKDFLTENGFKEYVGIFFDSGFESKESLEELDKEALIEMGVKIAHRNKLLRKIKKILVE